MGFRTLEIQEGKTYRHEEHHDVVELIVHSYRLVEHKQNEYVLIHDVETFKSPGAVPPPGSRVWSHGQSHEVESTCYSYAGGLSIITVECKKPRPKDLRF